MTKTSKSNKDSERKTFTFSNEILYQKVCGVQDSRIKELEQSLEVEIIPRGNSLLIGGEPQKIDAAIQFLQNLSQNYEKRPDKFEFDSFAVNYLLKTGQGNSTDWSPTDKLIGTHKGRNIFPKTKNQEKYIHSLMENMVTFAIGPAGTGKTFLAVAAACRLLQNGKIERIILTRPAVEAGESLGFLPGDMMQKVDPYLRPVYDALYECIGFEKTQELLSIQKIEIAPIAFMRGRTLPNSFIILDEAQNCTISQLKMILTRLGKNSKMSISGDITQVDLQHSNSGLSKVVNIFRKTKNIGVTEFLKEDISRHPLVEVIVKKFETL